MSATVEDGAKPSCVLTIRVRIDVEIILITAEEGGSGVSDRHFPPLGQGGRGVKVLIGITGKEKHCLSRSVVTRYVSSEVD